MDVETIRTMAVEQRWDEVKRYAPSLLDSLTGDDLARVHLYLSAAHFETAGNSRDWSSVVYHTEHGLSAATRSGPVYVWALQRLSSVYATSRRFGEAVRCGHEFLRLVSAFETLAYLTPYVISSLAHVEYRRGHFNNAITLRSQALHAFTEAGNANDANRLRLNLVWACVRAGRADEAKGHFLSCTYADDDALKLGANAAICYAEGDWNGVIHYGRLALSSKRRHFDVADASDVCLLMARAAVEIGRFADAFALIIDAANRALVLVQPAYIWSVSSYGGGEFPEATDWGGGWHPSARFSTGVA